MDTVGNRVDEIAGSVLKNLLFSRFSFLIFDSIVNTPTKKKPQQETPCYRPLFWYLPSMSKLWGKSWSFPAAEGSTLEANISSSFRNLSSIYILIRKLF
jgi:hypothetical protein